MPGLDVLDAVAGGELNVIERHYQFLVIVGDEPEWRILAFNGGFVNKHVGGLHIKAVVVLYCHKIYFLVFYCKYKKKFSIMVENFGGLMIFFDYRRKNC